jgi:hypothetical protein
MCMNVVELRYTGIRKYVYKDRYKLENKIIKM